MAYGFEKLNNSYSEHDKNLQKSINELSKFILDNISRPEFIEFIQGIEVSVDKQLRWEEHLEDLEDKITKRLGHHIELESLKKSAFKEILQRQELGELPQSNFLDNFCKAINKESH